MSKEKNYTCPKCGVGPSYARDTNGRIKKPAVYMDMTYHCDSNTTGTGVSSPYKFVAGANAEYTMFLSAIVGYRIDEKFPRFYDLFTEVEDVPPPFKKADFYVLTRMGGTNRTCLYENKSDCWCDAHKANSIEQEKSCVGSWDAHYDATIRTFAIRLTDSQREEYEDAIENGYNEDMKMRLFSLFPPLLGAV